MVNWEPVQSVLIGAKGAAWDGCHKIYILLDTEQMDLMESYGYGDGEGDWLVWYFPATSIDKRLKQIQDWYNESCELRFVDTVRTVLGDPNEGYIALIEQGDGDEEDY